MKKLQTATIYLGLSLLSLTLFLHLSLLIFSVPFISISLIYFSGGLTRKYKPLFIYSIPSFIIFSIVSFSMLLLYAFNHINVITISICIIIFLIIFFIQLMMYLKIQKEAIILTPLLTEITIISRFIPSASFFLFFPLILSNINYTITHYIFNTIEIDLPVFLLYLAGYVLIWILVVRRNLKFLTMNVKNADTRNIAKFVTITTLIPIITHILVFSLHLILIYHNKDISDFFFLYSIAIIVQIIYIRNFAQELIERLKKSNPFGFDSTNNHDTFKGNMLPDDILDADFTEF